VAFLEVDSHTLSGLGSYHTKITKVPVPHTSKGAAVSKKILSLVLVASLFNWSILSGFATPKEKSEADHIAKIKTFITKQGIGEKARVTINTKNKAEIKGYVSKVEGDTFDVTDPNTGNVSTVSYADVTTAKGRGMSKGWKIGIVAICAVAIVAIVLAVSVSKSLNELGNIRIV
jgi:hypothetical protein